MTRNCSRSLSTNWRRNERDTATIGAWRSLRQVPGPDLRGEQRAEPEGARKVSPGHPMAAAAGLRDVRVADDHGMARRTGGKMNKADKTMRRMLDLHESLRRSHCDHYLSCDPAHKCVGTTTISPGNVTLSCRLCGKDSLKDRIGSYQHEHGAARHACRVIEAVAPALKGLRHATGKLNDSDAGHE